MHTHVTTSPEEAAAFIRRGEIVAFPTETVYGLGADAFRPDAVRRIFTAKGRPADNPLICHIADRDQIEALAASVTEPARALMEAFFPGPLTLVLPRHPAVPEVVTGGLETVGVRMPRDPIALAFLRACGGPVAAPSANRSGRPSPTTWDAVLADLDGRIPCLLKGPQTEAGLESTVVDVTGEAPLVLRSGVVTLEMLRRIVPAARPAEDAHQLARSPGTRYRHYAPHARVCLVDQPPADPAARPAAYIGLTQPPAQAPFALRQVCPSVEAYARQLFHFFRRCDAAGIAMIYCQRVPPHGLGLALMDRLTRAAAA